MDDLGRPIAYLALAEGTPVFDRDGERIGTVERVVADLPMDIFEGVVVQGARLPVRRLFADPDQIAQMHEHGVLLKVGRGELAEYRDRTNPRRDSAGRPLPEGRLHALVRRAWDLISRRS
ncbi:PRC-barrel domain-containing protein [Saccharopolyspora erythraea]|uniref:PRC-barrel domain-containing protein n=1 Tax=Saccharopolyspora erythraea TaxID=1836 RepID=UPI001BA521DA|nr:PRC-barrel domain-containing protein [Saccharopolyspora erythraea]QUH04403.1 PRC-barrel domain-containing protein [Saccharopolyspora erythraea]